MHLTSYKLRNIGYKLENYFIRDLEMEVYTTNQPTLLMAKNCVAYCSPERVNCILLMRATENGGKETSVLLEICFARVAFLRLRWLHNQQLH